MRLWNLLIAVSLLSQSLLADQGNCRLVIQTYFENGKKKVEVVDVPSMSRIDCKNEATQRRIINSVENQEVVKVNVIFSYRGPAVTNLGN